MPSNPIDKVLGSDDGKHMVKLQCPKGHVHYYDKRTLCGARRPFLRLSEEQTPKPPAIEKDEISVTCLEEGCGVEWVEDIDCIGYR